MLAACTIGLKRRAPKTGKHYNSGLAEKVLVKSSPQSILPFVQFNYRIQQRGSNQPLPVGDRQGLRVLGIAPFVKYRSPQSSSPQIPCLGARSQAVVSSSSSLSGSLNREPNRKP